LRSAFGCLSVRRFYIIVLVGSRHGPDSRELPAQVALLRHLPPFVHRHLPPERVLRGRSSRHHRRPPDHGPPVRLVGLQPVPPPDPQAAASGDHGFAPHDHFAPRDQLPHHEDADPVHVQRRGHRLQGHPGAGPARRRHPQGERAVAPERGREQRQPPGESVAQERQVETSGQTRPERESGGGELAAQSAQLHHQRDEDVRGEERREGQAGETRGGEEKAEEQSELGDQEHRGGEASAEERLGGVGESGAKQRLVAVSRDQRGADRVERGERRRDGAGGREGSVQHGDDDQAGDLHGGRGRAGVVLAADVRALHRDFYASSRMGEARADAHGHVAGEEAEAGQELAGEAVPWPRTERNSQFFFCRTTKPTHLSRSCTATCVRSTSPRPPNGSTTSRTPTPSSSCTCRTRRLPVK
jgi:hypothetical protein